MRRRRAGRFAGVLAAPIIQVNPLMGSNLIIVVFAVVVIGGMGSILGLGHHRAGPGHGRRPDQSVLPRSVSRGHFPDHGASCCSFAPPACLARKPEQ
jgi:hypothetical protein